MPCVLARALILVPMLLCASGAVAAANPANAHTEIKVDVLWQQFAAKVAKVEADTNGVLGVAVVDLKTGRQWSLHGQEHFAQASTIKIPILLELYRQDQDGDGVHLADPYVVKAEDIIEDSAVLGGLTPGVTTLTNRDLATCVVAVSDDSATNILIHRVGMSRVNAVLDRMALPETRLKRKMLDVEAARAGRENVSTPEEMASLLAQLWRGDHGILNAATTERFFDLLATKKNSPIAAGLPADIKIADKPGELEGVRNDAGLVFLPKRPYVLVVMSAFLEREADGTDAIRQVSHAAFSLFDRLDRASDLGRVVSRGDGSQH